MRFSTSFLLLPTTVAAWSTSASSQSFCRIAPLYHTSRISCAGFSTTSTSSNSVAVRVLGVCGGIGSGKSFVCQTLVNELGCWAHLEADVIAHKVYEPNSQAVQEIVQEFGSHVLTENGHVDRKQLGEIVFSSPEQMSKLECIVWPYVKNEIRKLVDSYREQIVPENKFPVLVLEAAVLIDAGWDDMLDGLWVVRASEDQALERLQTQRGLTAADAKTRIEAQKVRRGIGNLQQEVDAGVVSCVIRNSASADELKAQLAKALKNSSCWYSSPPT
jgi:dephospho-CoA kinase